MDGKLYLIKRSNENDNCGYCAEHGEMGGVPDEILSNNLRYQEMQRELDAQMERGEDTTALVARIEQFRKALSALHSGATRTIIRGKIPDSRICFLDEIFKASDGILNALLTALNEPNEGTTIDIPTISFFSASNEIPNFSSPEEKILKPLYDRFDLKVVTEYVESRDARLAVLKDKQAQWGQLKPMPRALVTLDELEQMQQDVAQVAVPDSVNELMDDVLCELRGKGVHISDRKYFGYAPIAQAKAWLECRDDFDSAVDAPAARRVGKLRDEYVRL